MSGWVSIDALLLGRIDDGLREAQRRAGLALRCGRGCFGCCLGPFPITRADGLRLLQGWKESSPELRDSMASRAKEVVEQLPAQPAGDWLFDRQWQMLACPVLDLETGACRLYQHRPAACRTYGPAVRLDGVDLTPCPLNYEGWTPEQVEAARVSIDTADIAPTALSAMDATGEWIHGELTTVAHVLAAK